MYCSKCGRLVPDGKKFCAGCGQAINADGVIPQFSIASEPVDQPSKRLWPFFITAAILGLVILGVGLTLSVGRKPAGIGAGSKAQQAQAQESKRLQELLGDEVPCNVATVGHTTEIEQQCNVACIQGIHTFINRKAGTLTIVFNFDFAANRYKFPFVRFLVRMFDQNGQYLTHFTTAERYATNDESFEQLRSAGVEVIKLSNTNNVLQYPVNMRDASFVAMVEFGIAFGS